MTIKRCSLEKLAVHTNTQPHGDYHHEVEGVATLEKATANQISFLSNPAYKTALSQSKAGIVILTEKNLKLWPGNALISNNPYLTYAQIATLFAAFEITDLTESSLASSASIHDTAKVGKNCRIYPQAVISAHAVIGDNVTIGAGTFIGEHVKIGNHSIIEANATIHHHCELGQSVHIYSGVVIGSDGFGYAPNPNAERLWYKVPQLGRVLIGNHVEIGANTTVDRGAIDDTVIEDGVILDNQIQVGHNVHIGKNTAIAGCVAIAGSAKIGKNCLIGGCSGINGHITICDNTQISGGTHVTHSITEAGNFGGPLPFLPFNLWKRSALGFQKLAEYGKRIRNLEKKLEKQLDKSI